MPELKTLEEHFEYVKRMTRVSFFFARKWLVPQFPETSIGELIRDHTPALYHGLNYEDYQTKWDNPDCRNILSHANDLSALSPEDFEEEMWKFIEKLARKRAELTYPAAVGIQAPPDWNCGSLKYDLPANHPDMDPNWIVFHIANAVGPKSIFDDPTYLPCCFLLLMKEAEIRFNSNILYTSTWLNEKEEFLQIFPQEWRDNREPCDKKPVPGWHFGWWGQLVTGKGTVNPKTEKFARENGYLKYACRMSYCSFSSMRRHLKQFQERV